MKNQDTKRVGLSTVSEGQGLFSLTLKHERDQVLIPLEGLIEGTYLVTIEQENEVLGTEVLEVKR